MGIWGELDKPQFSRRYAFSDEAVASPISRPLGRDGDEHDDELLVEQQE